VAGRVLLESGIASGREPTATVAIFSYISQFLRETNVSLDAEDEEPFPMRLLHFRRTFVEKMFAIHKKVELFKRIADCDRGAVASTQRLRGRATGRGEREKAESAPARSRSA
jgi:hypothetical protein